MARCSKSQRQRSPRRSRPFSKRIGTIFLKSPRSIAARAEANVRSNASVGGGSHSMLGGSASGKRAASSSSATSSHAAGCRHGCGSSRKKSLTKKAGRSGRRNGNCSNGPQPMKTRSGAVWMKAKSRTARDCNCAEPAELARVAASLPQLFDVVEHVQRRTLDEQKEKCFDCACRRDRLGASALDD